MSDVDDIKLKVMKWYQDNHNVPLFPSFKRQVLTLETSLSTGKHPWCKDDGVDILEDYFTTFNVDSQYFSFKNYWPNEEVFMPFNFLRSKENKWKWIEPQPLTLKMLVESAKAGYWLYD
jgi:hypothetical protein